MYQLHHKLQTRLCNTYYVLCPIQLQADACFAFYDSMMFLATYTLKQHQSKQFMSNHVKLQQFLLLSDNCTILATYNAAQTAEPEITARQST